MPNAIHFAAGMADSPSRLPMHLIYFSFMTVTTVGYGDACPVHPVARSLAMTGRLYIGDHDRVVGRHGLNTGQLLAWDCLRKTKSPDFVQNKKFRF